MVRHSSGRIPASYAATRARSISRGRGSGSASAVTITSWSALATMTRSTGSSSSARAAQRRTCARSTSTIRASASVVARHVADDPHPVADDDALAAERPGLHRDDVHGRRPSSVKRPRSTVTHDAVDGVLVAGPVLGARPGAAPGAVVVLLVVLVVAPLARLSRPTAITTAARPRASAKSGKVLLVVRDVLDQHAVDGRADDHAGVRHPVVVVGVEEAAVQRRRAGSRARRRSRSRRPPAPLSSRASAASRSVSWPRRWAMPRSRDGDSASAHSAAITGVELADVVQVERRRPSSRSGPGRRSGRRRRASTAAADAASAGRAARRRPGWCARPVADGDRPAGDHGRGQERRRVGQVGLDHVVERP